MSAPVIAIDGPSGTGKGTIARLLKALLGWHLLDSGALYRVTAARAADLGVALDDEPGVAAIAASLPVEFTEGADETCVWLAGVDVSTRIRSEEAGAAASRVAALGSVRAALLDRQRDFRQPPGLIADGRDMGTVVFTDAELKIFLTASVEERAQRRYKQLNEKGMGGSLPQLLGDIAERDRRDRERTVAPLKPATDAIVIDTTARSIAAVLDEVERLVRERGLVNSRN